MKKHAGKRYARGKFKAAFVIPPAPEEKEGVGHEPMDRAVVRVRREQGFRLRRDGEWGQVWGVVKTVPRQMGVLCLGLVGVAKQGTAEGRWVRVTPLQAEMVLGMHLVFAISFVCWVIGWFV